MVIYNAATKELTAKIVYYGPGLCGKTTNLKVLHDRLEPGTAGKLLNLQTQTDRTIYFDLLPVELGDIKGYKIRFQLATVPGQTAFNETRRVVLKGVDGIVFVADSQWTMLPKNLESWQNLKDNLKSNEITFESIPVVVQYNKRDLADILAVDAMQEALGLSSYPYVEAVASAGRGVTETFKLISKLTFVDLLRRLQGRRAEEEAAAAPPEEARADDLQTWKESLLNRESQPTPVASGPRERSSRPLSLVPPVSELAPFDTTELSRGVDDDEAPPSPYAVQGPPDLEPAVEADGASPAQTIRMEAIRDDQVADSAEPIESLTEADEVELEIPMEVEPPADPAFLAAEAMGDPRGDVAEPRPHTPEEPAYRGGETDERMVQAVASLRERAEATAAHVTQLAERLSGMEKGIGALHETVGSLLQRLGSIESEASRPHPEVERGLKALEARLGDLDDRLRSEATHQRKDADDVAMALRGLNERSQHLDQQFSSLSHQLGGQQGTLVQLSGLGDRLPQLESQLAVVRDAIARLPELEGAQGAMRDTVARLPELDAQVAAIRDTISRLPELETQIANLREAASRLPEIEGQVQTALQQHHELESTLEEKTHQGRREAEDIRSQIAPLLEERVRRHESDALLFAEMERLRESLAESLHDLAERVRSRIRE
jgi:mutual gliding-motility protein MglA